MIQFANLYKTALVGAIDDVTTSVEVVSIAGAPAAGAGDFFFIGITRVSDGQVEIMKVTAIAGTTLTVERNVDGRGALAFLAGDLVACRVTSETLNILHNKLLTDGGVADAYSVDPATAASFYYEGMPITFKAANANTGVSTLEVGTLGSIALKRPDGSDLKKGDILAGSIVSVMYNGTDFTVVSSLAPALKEAATGSMYLAVPAGQAVANAAVDPISIVDTADISDRVTVTIATAKFTVEKAGRYLLGYNSQLSIDAATTHITLQWFKNAAGIAATARDVYAVASGQNENADFSYPVDLAAGDEVDLRVSHDSGSPQTITFQSLSLFAILQGN